MTRKFSTKYSEDDIYDTFTLAQTLLNQIEYYIQNEELSEIERKFLVESQKYIEELIKKYESGPSVREKISLEQISFGFKTYNDPKYQALSAEEYNRIYQESSETLKMFRKDFEKVFEIEETIYKLITIPLWKKSTTNIEIENKPGDEFTYIVHSGEGIIYLPGFPDYRKTRNINGDYVSASLITDKQMAMFLNSQVGLILKANEAIICSTEIDSGTNISFEPKIRTIIDFKNGTYVNSGVPGCFMLNGELLATTKIQSPHQLIDNTIKRQKNNERVFSNNSRDVNEIVLDDSKVEIIGVFFKTNGCEINLEDFGRAIFMERAYNVPLKIVNSSIYRKKLGLEKYDPQDFQKYKEYIDFWSCPDNWKNLIDDPLEFRELIKRYFNDVVVKQEYEPEIRKEIEEIFTRIIEFTYSLSNSEKNSSQTDDTIPQK